MAFLQQPPPPPYQPVQLPTPTPAPVASPFNQPSPQIGYPQVQFQQQFQPQQGQSPQVPQGQIAQPQYVQSPQPMQQPYQGLPNMTQQQIQQVQQVIQSYPPEKLQLVQQQLQQTPPQYHQPPQPPLLQSPPAVQQTPPKPHFTTTAPSGLFGSKSKSHPSPSGPPDAQKSDSVKRFFGDTLVGRVARSSLQTATSISKLPSSLSPWGDNNPVTLPNIRYRDAALFTTFAFVGGPLVDGLADGVTGAFGADSFVSEIVNSGAGAIAASTVLKYGVFQIVEQAIDKGVLEHLLPEEDAMIVTTSVKSLQIGIKHKLMGVDADVRFVGVYTAADTSRCEKGWFCPYLFASARTPSIPRANDFAIAQSFGPFLAGDYLLARKLLAETIHVLPLCEANPEVDIGTNRMIVLFTGLAPYRGVWSQSRRPGIATLLFHLPSGCPALVIPVTKSAPITAWSPWTLSQMTNPASGYRAEWQHEQICEYLDTIISLPHVSSALQKSYVDVLGRMVSLVINGALGVQRCQEVVGKLDPERAGVVMLRY